MQPEPRQRQPQAAAAAGPLSKRKTVAQHLEEDDASTMFAILLPSGFPLEEGTQLWRGVRLGKLLGAGAQAKVFRLARDDGSPTGKVIKINHSDPISKSLNNNVVWVGMDREWEIGTQLRAALQEPGGNVPGFMKVMDCLVSSSGANARFSGMLMGELHGWEVYKRIQAPEFHNIRYVREMLFQVFSALDRAQSKLGFVHSDLGMRNVMEHYPTLWEDLPPEEAERQRAQLRVPGFTINRDGSRAPLGPEVEFKIIDFGISKFSSKVAAASGGREAQEVVERLHERCAGEERIVFGAEGSGTHLEFAPGDVAQGVPRLPRLQFLRTFLHLPGKNGKFFIKRAATCAKQASRLGRGAATAPERSLASGSGDVLAASPRQQQPAAAVGTIHEAADEGDEEEGYAVEVMAEEEDLPTRMLSVQDVSFSRAAVEAAASRRTLEARREADACRRKKRKRSPIETMYRSWWYRKMDIFHLLLTMALALDDRTWPEEDEDEVQAFCSLVHHVTGVRMRARFLDVETAVAAVRAGRPFPYGRCAWQHWFRRWNIRMRAHLFPFNSGLLAREALTHPFFGVGRVQHATVPCSIADDGWGQGAHTAFTALFPAASPAAGKAVPGGA